MELFKKFLKSLVIGSIAGLAIAFFTNNFFQDLIDRLEKQTYDRRYKWANEDLSKDAVEKMSLQDYGINIVDIDDRSMDKMGTYWNWNRSFHADLIKALNAHDPAAIVFDILLFNPEDTTFKKKQEVLFSRLEQRGNVEVPYALKQNMLSAIDYDKQLIDATRDAGSVFNGVQMSNESDYSEVGRSQIQHKKAMAWHESLHPSSTIMLSDAVHAQVFNVSNSKPVIDGCFPPLAQASRDIGYLNMTPDDDGTIRALPIMFAFGKHKPVYLPMSVRVMTTLFGTPDKEIVFEPKRYLDIGKPFKIFADNTGALTCSWPHVTIDQVQALLERSADINALALKKSIDVTSMVRIGKDSAGQKTISMDAGDFPPSLTASFLSSDFAKILGTAIGDRYELAPDIGISHESDVSWTLTAPEGDEEWYLSTVDVQTLARIKQAHFDRLVPGKKKLLFYNLTIRNLDGQLVSTIPVLRGQTLKDLTATQWNTIAGLRPKSRMDFGPQIRIPLSPQNENLITFFGPPKKPFPYYSYYDILNNRVKGGLEGKIFLIGSTTSAMFDIKPVPLDKYYPGVEIHASLMNSFLNNLFITRLAHWQDFLVILLVGIIIGIITYMLKPLPGVILTLLSVFVYFLFAMHVFGSNNLWIEIVRPVLAIILTFGGVFAYRYITEEKDRKYLQSTFKQYLSPDLIDQMYKSKQRPQLGGEEGIRTAYFTDIQGFSTFSEKLGSPTRLVELLNEYLSAMTDILVAHFGTLDKYEGDAIIAFYGAPVHMDDHAIQACATAIDMQKKLGELRAKWTSEGDKWPTIVHQMRMRIGVNSGPIVTGNMGSHMRMNFTMMGDAVNLAARLESAAKQYGVYSMISGMTYDLVKDHFECRQLDKVNVVGKSEPVVIYELMAKKGELEPAHAEMVNLYNQALALYLDRQWDAAIEMLHKSNALEPFREITPKGLTPSTKLIESCENNKTNPPPPEWQGETALTSK